MKVHSTSFHQTVNPYISIFIIFLCKNGGWESFLLSYATLCSHTTGAVSSEVTLLSHNWSPSWNDTRCNNIFPSDLSWAFNIRSQGEECVCVYWEFWSRPLSLAGSFVLSLQPSLSFLQDACSGVSFWHCLVRSLPGGHASLHNQYSNWLTL